MRKLATLLAGILMVCGVYAAEVTTEAAVAVKPVEQVKATEEVKPSSSWDFSGTNVEYIHTLSDSQTKTVYGGDDIDLILKVKKNIDADTWISAKYDTDDSDPDTKIEILANRKLGKYLEVQVDLDLITSNDEGGIELKEDRDSTKSFIKYMATDKLTLKFAPFDMDLGMGTELATDTQPVIPGVQADYTLSDAFSIYAGIGSRSVDRDGKDAVTAIGFKAGFGYTPSENFSLSGALSTANEPDKDLELEETVSPGKTAANLTLAYKAGKIGLDVEGAFVAMNKAGVLIEATDTDPAVMAMDKSGTGLYAKLSYDLGNTMKNVATVPYVSLKNYSEYFYFDDDASFQNVDHGGVTIAALGVDLTTSRGLTITPEIEFGSAKNKVFGDKKTATLVTTTVALEF
jgi:hypothetical protein